MPAFSRRRDIRGEGVRKNWKKAFRIIMKSCLTLGSDSCDPRPRLRQRMSKQLAQRVCSIWDETSDRRTYGRYRLHVSEAERDTTRDAERPWKAGASS